MKRWQQSFFDKENETQSVKAFVRFIQLIYKERKKQVLSYYTRTFIIIFTINFN